MQIDTSTIQVTCSPFLSASYATLLDKETLSSTKQNQNQTKQNKTGEMWPVSQGQEEES